MIVFGIYENLKIKLNYKNKISKWITSALIADFIGAFWLCPFEIIKQK
jgi:hypothetical protein